jgi:hypothetical protein
MTQAVLVHLHLSDAGLGTEEDDEAIEALEEQLERTITEAGVGEFDGHEFGGGECILFLYGPSADDLFAVIERHLAATPIADWGFAIKRYGDVYDRAAKEVRVEWPAAAYGIELPIVATSLNASVSRRRPLTKDSSVRLRSAPITQRTHPDRRAFVAQQVEERKPAARIARKAQREVAVAPAAPQRIETGHGGAQRDQADKDREQDPPAAVEHLAGQHGDGHDGKKRYHPVDGVQTRADAPISFRIPHFFPQAMQPRPQIGNYHNNEADLCQRPHSLGAEQSARWGIAFLLEGMDAWWTVNRNPWSSWASFSGRPAIASLRRRR